MLDYWLCLSYTHVRILCDSMFDYMVACVEQPLPMYAHIYVTCMGCLLGLMDLDFEVCTTLALLHVGSCEHKLDNVCEYTN